EQEKVAWPRKESEASARPIPGVMREVRNHEIHSKAHQVPQAGKNKERNVGGIAKAGNQSSDMQVAEIFVVPHAGMDQQHPPDVTAGCFALNAQPDVSR